MVTRSKEEAIAILEGYDTWIGRSADRFGPLARKHSDCSSHNHDRDLGRFQVKLRQMLRYFCSGWTGPGDRRSSISLKTPLAATIVLSGQAPFLRFSPRPLLVLTYSVELHPLRLVAQYDSHRHDTRGTWCPGVPLQVLFFGAYCQSRTLILTHWHWHSKILFYQMRLHLSFKDNRLRSNCQSRLVKVAHKTRPGS
ncbi:hypothetical protein EDB87DRAFT_383605 [Lactarius vividus]|nr:hypothetical protein EDB87DRAFT_383605 [Lactarius vividus]